MHKNGCKMPLPVWKLLAAYFYLPYSVPHEQERFASRVGGEREGSAFETVLATSGLEYWWRRATRGVHWYQSETIKQPHS
jgi:hypothetical protein